MPIKGKTANLSSFCQTLVQYLSEIAVLGEKSLTVTLIGRYLRVVCVEFSDTTDVGSMSDNCNSELFHCATGGCISLSFLCDFITQCPDGSDEEHCGQ